MIVDQRETSASITHSYKVKCDCCGMETMAEIRDDRIIIMDRRHGKKHIAVLSLRDILDKMKMLHH